MTTAGNDERLGLETEAETEAAAETEGREAAAEAAADERLGREADERLGREAAAEAAAEARCAAICGDTHTPLSFALADMRAATFIASPYRQ
jgi:hypothetical protein